METETIIYVVAGALILRVLVKVIWKYTKEKRAFSAENQETD